MVSNVAAAAAGNNNNNIQAHDQGPFQSYAWLEEDMQPETKEFISQVEEYMDSYVF